MNPLINDTLLPLDIEKQIQQLQAQRSNLPKVDVGEKVSVNDLTLHYNFDFRFVLHQGTRFSVSRLYRKILK